MPRSKYIYFIQMLEHKLLGAFTVKCEALDWAFRMGRSPERVNLSQMADGTVCDKIENQSLGKSNQ